MELHDVIQNRRSIRKFKTDPVPESLIRELINTARLAPSAANIQPTRYVIVQSTATKEQLTPYTLPFVTKAPVIIICCIDTTAWSTALTRFTELKNSGIFRDNIEDGKRIETYQQEGLMDRMADSQVGRMHLWQNAAIAIDHLTLRAVDLGLSSCWVGLVDREKVKALLGLEEQYEVVALLPIGYADQEAAPRPRMGLDEVLLQVV